MYGMLRQDEATRDPRTVRWSSGGWTMDQAETVSCSGGLELGRGPAL